MGLKSQYLSAHQLVIEINLLISYSEISPQEQLYHFVSAVFDYVKYL